MTGLSANLEIREKSGNQFLSQIGKSQRINFCLKLGKVRESIFVSNWEKSGNQFLSQIGKSQRINFCLKLGKVREFSIFDEKSGKAGKSQGKTFFGYDNFK